MVDLVDYDIALEDEGIGELVFGPPFTIIDERITLAEKFCHCRNMDNCRCGENSEGLDWCWDEESMTAACQVTKEGTEVMFHPRFSVGTACVRADRPLRYGYQHYFELKVLTPCFGTDIMVGVGTEKADMHKYERRFASLLGCCNETWGLSYKGGIYHNEQWSEYHSGFGQGSIVGVHIDLWRGRISYHINRKLIGVAFVDLRNPSAEYYPMICSTAAKSRFRLIAARSYATNLQYFCCNTVRHAVPSGERFLSGVLLPPALKLYLENNLKWLLIGTALKRTKRRMTERGETAEGQVPEESGLPSTSSSVSPTTTTEPPLRGAARLAHFAHRMALIPMLTLQIDDRQRQAATGPQSAPVLDARMAERRGSLTGAAASAGERARSVVVVGDDDDEESSDDGEGYSGPLAKKSRP